MRAGQVFALMVVGALSRVAATPVAYDPLAVTAAPVVSRTFEVSDAARQRVVPLRVYLPETLQPAPVIVFSHGLGGSRDNNPYLGNHWAQRGYVVVLVQHPGSDESVWQGVPAEQRLAAMKKAASLPNFLARNKDISAVIDALTLWNGDAKHPLSGRLDLKHLGMSGHSFGAQTTQAVAGQEFIRGSLSFREPRIQAAVMMSPGPPATGDPVAAFAPIRIPCLLMTGTQDGGMMITTTGPADRLKVFPCLQHAPAWQVVFDQATHMDFSERDMLGKPPANPRYHRAILALTTAFWDAELQGNAGARAWLNGPGARTVLAPADQWELNALARQSADLPK